MQVIAKETTQTFARFYAPHRCRSITVLSHYQKRPVKSAIHASKFYNNTHAAKLLGNLLDLHLSTLPPETIIVPIPLSPGRGRERGHNQVVSILKSCSHPIAKQYQMVLIRSRETKPQSHLPRSERLKNVRGCFLANVVPDLNPKVHFLIMDDVVTTGATLGAAATALRHTYPNASVDCLAIAH